MNVTRKDFEVIQTLEVDDPTPRELPHITGEAFVTRATVRWRANAEGWSLRSIELGGPKVKKNGTASEVEVDRHVSAWELERGRHPWVKDIIALAEAAREEQLIQTSLAGVDLAAVADDMAREGGQQ